MAITTRTSYDLKVTSFDEITEIRAKGDELMPLQTQPPYVYNDPVTGYLVSDRYWVDMESATNWLAFVEPYHPVEAIIVP